MSGDVVILFVSGEDAEDQPIYAYVALVDELARLDAFMAARASGDFRPDDFGVVLASGVGQPPDDVQARIAAEWGFDISQMPSVFDAGEVRELSAAAIAKRQRLMQ